jgi:hypothetical protein
LGFHSDSPLFSSTDQFVLFADEEITLEENTQVSSGDLGSNGDLKLSANALASGDLFADKITLNKGASVNGNASYNKLRSATGTQILGTQTKPISLPIANLPALPDFTVGMTSLTITGTSTILSPNNYRDITLNQGSTLTLSSGTHTLRSLELKEGSTLMFMGTTTLSIQRALKGEKHVFILPGANTHPDQLTINYNGFKEKNVGTRDHFDDDKDASDTFDNDNERKDWQKGKSAQPITFGERAFLNFRLIAPKASVTIGKESILRGQVVAGKIRVRKGSLLSRDEDFLKDIDPSKIIEEQGIKYVVNEILILMSDGATSSDVKEILGVIGGTIVGVVDDLGIIKVQIPTSTVLSQQQTITMLKNLNSPFIAEVIPNFLFN